MHRTDSEVVIKTVDTYSLDVMAGIGMLMPQLDPNFQGTPMSKSFFKQNFADTDRSILVAMQGEAVVGTAVMNTVVEQAPEAKTGYMGGFVVDQAARGNGAAVALWRGMEQWCADKGLGSFGFNTERHRERAIAFYRKMGAQLVEGTDSHYIVCVTESEPRVALPSEIQKSYFNHNDVTIRQISSGIVNNTFVAETNTDTSVLQQLNEVFDERLMADYEVVTRHLAAHGWEVPELIGTLNGEASTRDTEGRVWRQVRYIESDAGVPEGIGNTTLTSIGNLLGRWHKTMASLDYEPAYTLPHFHDTEFYAASLRDYLPLLPDEESMEFAARLLSEYDKLPILPDTAAQLIHGDPQLTNILFRNGEPVTYIDLDTVMRGSIWIDIGDLLRVAVRADGSAERLQYVIEGYLQTAQPEADPRAFYEAALTATQLISLELAMRFLNDIVDDNYFKWNDKKFSSRRDNHMHSAKTQWEIFDCIEKYKERNA